MKCFPEDFTWGAATSAYQIEGGVDLHERGPSVWDAFCREPGRVLDGSTGDVACDHARRYREDVAIMRRIGLQAYRLSISWPRVIPDGDGDVSDSGLSFYDRLVDELLDAGIEPWVTLFHWDYPLALHHRGGWLNPASPDWFERYVRIVVDRLSDRVGAWITLNEPQVFIDAGYAKGTNAPGLRLSWPDQLRIAHHVLVSHGRAVSAIRERAKSRPRIGWSPVGIVQFPADPEPETIDAARVATFAPSGAHLWTNTWFGDPACLGHYPSEGLAVHGEHLPDAWEDDMTSIHQPIDFYGLNIYRGDAVRVGDNGRAKVIAPADGCPRTAFEWDITPPVLYWGPRFFHERYDVPIVITENGMSSLDWVATDGGVHDPQRIDYATRHLRELGRATRDGVPVQGYFHWSLMDNFEWAAGYRQRFGLVHVDYQTLKRTIKDSAHWYADVIRTHGGGLLDDEQHACAEADGAIKTDDPQA